MNVYSIDKENVCVCTGMRQMENMTCLRVHVLSLWAVDPITLKISFPCCLMRYAKKLRSISRGNVILIVFVVQLQPHLCTPLAGMQRALSLPDPRRAHSVGV